MKNHVYMIFVIVKYLDKYSVIKDRLGEICVENHGEITGANGNDIDLLLYGVTDRKKYLNEFFIYHKKDMFIVRKYKIETALDVYSDFISGKYYKPTKLQDKFSPYWISPYTIGIRLFSEGKLTATVVRMALTEDEFDMVQNCYDAFDELCYDIQKSENTLNLLYDKIFSKKLKKSLDKIQFKETLDSLCALSGQDNIPGFTICEYGFLLDLYGEVFMEVIT